VRHLIFTPVAGFNAGAGHATIDSTIVA